MGLRGYCTYCFGPIGMKLGIDIPCDPGSDPRQQTEQDAITKRKALRSEATEYASAKHKARVSKATKNVSAKPEGAKRLCSRAGLA